MRWLGWWALALVAGALLVAYAPGAWPTLGMLIVVPTVIALMLFAWGYLIYRVAKLFGRDPRSSDTFGLWVFVSFGFLVGPIIVAWLRHR